MEEGQIFTNKPPDGAEGGQNAAGAEAQVFSPAKRQ